MLSRSALLATLLLAVAADARACSVPVFRYALDRWPADSYEVIVFHRGPLKDQHRDLVARLKRSDPEPANVEVLTVDLADNPTPAQQFLWDEQNNATLPWMVVRYPAAVRREVTVWAAPLTEKTADRLLDSPIRREITRLIRGGETSVWVLLECGDKVKDDAAAERIRKELKRMPSVLQLPDLKADDPEDRLSPGPKLRIAFSFLRLSRTDAAELALVQMLVNTEEDLKEFEQEPMVFPIFGRGRADYALVGKGITEENVEMACKRLVGPCTCTVKRQYPGVDLLIRSEWTEPPREKKTSDPVAASDKPDEEAVAAADSRLNGLLLVLGLGVAGMVGAVIAFGMWWR